MSILVKQFDENRAKAELKRCPKIVQDYVKLLQKQIIGWKDIAGKAIGKLKQQAQEGINQPNLAPPTQADKEVGLNLSASLEA